MERKTKIVVGCVVVALVVVFGLVVVVGWYATNRLTYDPSKLPKIDVPEHPAPPDNGWAALAAAARQLDPYGDAIAEAAKADWDEDRPVPPACASALAAAHAALEKECVHPQPPSASTSVTYTKDLRGLTRAFMVEGRTLERGGRHADAARVYVDALKLDPIAARNGDTMHWLTGCAIVAITTPEMSRCVGSGGLNEADLVWLMDEIRSAESSTVPLHEALAISWALADQELAAITASPGRGRLTMSAIYTPARKALHKEMARAIAATKDPDRTDLHVFQATGNSYADMYLPITGGATRKVKQRRAQLLGLRAHAAIQRHRLRSGDWLKSLSELEVVPIDPFTGDPMLYERRDGGYVLYSTGQNEVDDGGTESFDWETNHGDIIIWP